MGQAIAGLPAVSRVLHADARCELYVLGGADQRVLILPSVGAERVEIWLKAQDSRIITAIQILADGQTSIASAGLAIALVGQPLVDVDLTEAPQVRLKDLFGAMLDSVLATGPTGMFPDFDRAFIWETIDGAALCSVLPLDGAVPAQVDQCRLVASAFYRLAAGVDPAQTADGLAPLKNWSKFAGEDLSRLVERCLAPKAPRGAITSLESLAAAMGRPAARSASEGADVAPATAPLVDAGGNGLAKVAGMDVLKALLRREVVAPLRDPEPYRRYGLTIPNGLLLYGPPGCGKTYIARQLADELGHHFIEIIPSEVASPYVHGTVLRIREAFDEAAEHAPSVVFIDEFEALVPVRGELGGFQDYKASEVNEFLAHLNNCSEHGVFVIAATNQPERIDPAVKRTGRLDKLIYVGPPDLDARREMLALHLAGRPVDEALDILALAKALNGYSASDVRFLVDEAARDAFRAGRPIGEESFAAALTHIRPSVPPEVEAQYRSVEQRGG